MTAYTPQTVTEATELISERVHSKCPLQILGTGSRTVTGETDTVSTTNLNEVIFFHPEDMVIGVGTGMNVRRLKSIVAEKNMCLRIEEYSPHTTVGSSVATSDSGAAQLFGGGIRDQIIGAEYINGHGESVKGGGKVVKNVAGYDIPKMLIGSQGGLGLITQINFKVFPAGGISKTGVIHTENTSFVRILKELNKKFIPIDHLRVISNGKTFTLAIGYSGNPARIERLEKELAQLTENDAEYIDDNEHSNLSRHLPDATTYSAFSIKSKMQGCALHLQIFSEPSMFNSEKVWQQLLETGCQILCHPFSGDIHLFYPGEADQPQLKEIIHRLIAVFPEKYKSFLLHFPTDVFSYSDFSELPGHLKLAKILKKSVDPENIFHSTFFTHL